ncbi:hypothetical protein J522_2972 [Acinetobacter baumannii 146457]|nr:hypothetical protein J522_2972 [Acinetobacter baumannii 146457]
MPNFICHENRKIKYFNTHILNFIKAELSKGLAKDRVDFNEEPLLFWLYVL